MLAPFSDIMAGSATLPASTSEQPGSRPSPTAQHHDWSFTVSRDLDVQPVRSRLDDWSPGALLSRPGATQTRPQQMRQIRLVVAQRLVDTLGTPSCHCADRLPIHRASAPAGRGRERSPRRPADPLNVPITTTRHGVSATEAPLVAGIAVAVLVSKCRGGEPRRRPFAALGSQYAGIMTT